MGLEEFRRTAITEGKCHIALEPDRRLTFVIGKSLILGDKNAVGIGELFLGDRASHIRGQRSRLYDRWKIFCDGAGRGYEIHTFRQGKGSREVGGGAGKSSYPVAYGISRTCHRYIGVKRAGWIYYIY